VNALLDLNEQKEMVRIVNKYTAHGYNLNFLETPFFEKTGFLASLNELNA
jgi:hypothetical protein